LPLVNDGGMTAANIGMGQCLITLLSLSGRSTRPKFVIHKCVSELQKTGLCPVKMSIKISFFVVKNVSKLREIEVFFTSLARNSLRKVNRNTKNSKA
jgi:hypothetical protein